ncbi:hypothetical protein YC2023_101542 [Brassica napus]
MEKSKKGLLIKGKSASFVSQPKGSDCCSIFRPLNTHCLSSQSFLRIVLQWVAVIKTLLQAASTHIDSKYHAKFLILLLKTSLNHGLEPHYENDRIGCKNGYVVAHYQSLAEMSCLLKPNALFAPAVGKTRKRKCTCFCSACVLVHVCVHRYIKIIWF